MWHCITIADSQSNSPGFIQKPSTTISTTPSMTYLPHQHSTSIRSIAKSKWACPRLSNCPDPSSTYSTITKNATQLPMEMDTPESSGKVGATTTTTTNVKP
mmetsp:Transcript_14385/g.30917  ORF Transcript_14385/g.30917 Transcript_14385/m.30917 type:complete len:101 (-) Transcript_14385:221-523(-)